MSISVDNLNMAGPMASRFGGKPKPGSWLLFLALLLAGLGFVAYSLVHEISAVGARDITYLPFILLGVALLIALGFEFVNGFHDTANAVATVIYTNSLPPAAAVVWSGLFNFIGVLVSSGTVAFGIISLLPVELILQVGSGSGFAMVFALLIAAILWNLGTWWLGLPASSSHTMIGSIIGVGVANALLHGRSGSSGVDWSQAIKVGYSLLLSPLLGFVLAASLLLLLKSLVKRPELYHPPQGDAPPPWWIRGLLILTCTGVSYAHGSNDGQKGMGLIMLILVGTVPMAYGLNRAMPVDQMTQFAAVAQVTAQGLQAYAEQPIATDPRPVLSAYIRSRQRTPQTIAAVADLASDLQRQVLAHHDPARLPAALVGNMRNDMYLSSEAIRLLEQDPGVPFDAATKANLTAYSNDIHHATRFIPLWVKIAVAIALGLGTMIGWKRVVITVGEKIGKTHLNYAQGASAELVAMATIGAADGLGLPVSTTHVLASGVAGTMAAGGAGLQMTTLRNLALAWVLTLPAAMLLSALLYALFSQWL